VPAFAFNRRCAGFDTLLVADVSGIGAAVDLCRNSLGLRDVAIDHNHKIAVRGEFACTGCANAAGASSYHADTFR
jgi:hypothetical protein